MFHIQKQTKYRIHMKNSHNKMGNTTIKNIMYGVK